MDTLLIVGDGPVCEALVPMARLLGWNAEAHSTLDEALAVLPDARAVVVTSHDHEVGPAALQAALESEHAAVGREDEPALGMLGGERRIDMLG